jgi:hypothetical protein
MGDSIRETWQQKTNYNVPPMFSNVIGKHQRWSLLDVSFNEITLVKGDIVKRSRGVHLSANIQTTRDVYHTQSFSCRLM